MFKRYFLLLIGLSINSSFYPLPAGLLLMAGGASPTVLGIAGAPALIATGLYVGFKKCFSHRNDQNIPDDNTYNQEDESYINSYTTVPLVLLKAPCQSPQENEKPTGCHNPIKTPNASEYGKKHLGCGRPAPLPDKPKQHSNKPPKECLITCGKGNCPIQLPLIQIAEATPVQEKPKIVTPLPEDYSQVNLPRLIYKTVKETGEKCRIVRPLNDEHAASEWAPKKYDEIRTWKDDIQKIAQNTGWEESKIKRIKNHLFHDEHILRHGINKFGADPEIAAAWDRLYAGDFIRNDIRLLEHEYFESRFERIFKTDYDTAHNKTKDSGRAWDAPIWENN